MLKKLVEGERRKAEDGKEEMGNGDWLRSTRRAAEPLGGLHGVDRCLDLGPNGVDRLAQVVGELHSQPVSWRLIKIGAEMQVGLRCDPALFVDDFVDPLMGELRVFCESVGGDPHGLEKLFQQQFAGMDIEVLFHGFSDSR